MNKVYLSEPLKKALLAGAEALRSQISAVEIDLEKQIKEKPELADGAVVRLCQASCEDYAQYSDIIEGFVKRNEESDEARN